jgi:acyl-CoA thioesterase I
VALLLCVCMLALSSCNTVSAPMLHTRTHSTNPTLTYVALGASDTFGIGADDPYTENWPTDLSHLLNTQAHLINLGVPSMTLHTALTAELPIALDSHPNLVTIWLAVNDLATHVPVGNYSHDLDIMLSRLQAAAPHARIAVGNVPDLLNVPFFHTYNQRTLSQQMLSYNTAIARMVQRHQAILVDLSAQGYDLHTFPEYVSHDGLHPSSTGYLRLAQLFDNALNPGAAV